MFRTRRIHLSAEGDLGAMAILLAAATVVLAACAALAVDIGSDYANRRQMQNAVDAGALAGARVLSDGLYAGDPTAPVPPGLAVSVEAAVQDAVASNGGETTTPAYSCHILATNGTDLGTCASSGWVDRAKLPVTVRVTSGMSQQSLFGGIAGVGRNGAGAVAAARTQPLVKGSGPFLVCYQQQQDGDSGPPLPPLLLGSPPVAPYPVNPAAIGQTYLIHGPQVSDCGLGDSSFKGLADDPQAPYSLPGLVDTDTGTHAGPVRVKVAGTTCTDVDTLGCVVILPICIDATEHGHNARMFCVAWGGFKISQVAANKHAAVFLGTVDVAGGQGGVGLPEFGKPSVTKLTE